jgi:hypothetical protein
MFKSHAVFQQNPTGARGVVSKTTRQQIEYVVLAKQYITIYGMSSGKFRIYDP